MQAIKYRYLILILKINSLFGVYYATIYMLNQLVPLFPLKTFPYFVFSSLVSFVCQNKPPPFLMHERSMVRYAHRRLILLLKKYADYFNLRRMTVSESQHLKTIKKIECP
jgi:hypothetical protein